MRAVVTFATACLASVTACHSVAPSSKPSPDAAVLAETTYRDGKSAIDAAIHGTHRLPANVARDRYRHPAETLAFFGFEPTMTVLDVNPGTGWYTELLAPALAKQGKYIATATQLRQAEHSETHWSAEDSERYEAFLARSPAVYGKAQTLFINYEQPHLDLDGQLDMVLMFREVHMMRNWGTFDAWLREAHRALKPGGVLGIVEHRAAPNAPPVDWTPPPSMDAPSTLEGWAKAGYMNEASVIAKVEAAGFELAGKSEINANPKDTRDHENGVWSLPPELRLGAKDRDRYLAIGESDRMTLKFVKVAKASP